MRIRDGAREQPARGEWTARRRWIIRPEPPDLHDDEFAAILAKAGKVPE